MSSITLIQPHYLIETDIKIGKQTIKITASKWFARLSDGSQKLYFVTLYEGRIIQVIDSIVENSLKDNEDAIAITKKGNILYYIEKEAFTRELTRDPLFIVKRYFEQQNAVHQLSQRLHQIQDAEVTRLENSRLDKTSSGESKPEHNNDTILSDFQKRAQALKKRITSPSCALVMMFGIITALATAIIGIEVSK